MAENILITGGAGFIGANLALNLVGRGYGVTVLDNLSEQIHGSDPLHTSPTYKRIFDKVNFIKGSVTSQADLERAIKNIDTIIHLAAETGTGQSMYLSGHYNAVNIGGTELLLDVLANTRHSVKKFVVASSRAVYGEGKYFCEGLGFVYPEERKNEDMLNGDFGVKYPGCNVALKAVATDENSKIHPSSVYGTTKQGQEELVMKICPGLNITPVAMRYQNVYGPGQSLNNPYTGILSIFSALIKSGKEINIFEDGRSTRDLIYIDDAVNATILAIEMTAANGEIFNVGTGVATEILTVAQTLMKNFKMEVPLNISGNYRLGDIRHNFADTGRINKILGFTPKVSFEEGARLFTEWVNGQEIPESGYERSLEEMKRRGLFN
jgi:dTDP-L-rhamnose 4-epimerase